jgi:hypothetical protein
MFEEMHEESGEGIAGAREEDRFSIEISRFDAPIPVKFTKIFHLLILDILLMSSFRLGPEREARIPLIDKTPRADSTIHNSHDQQTACSKGN